MRTHHRRVDDTRRQSPRAPQLNLSDDQIRAVYRLMYRHVGNRGEAETLTARACSETLRLARDFGDEDQQSLDGLLARTAREVAAEHLRWFYGSPAPIVTDDPGGEHADAPSRARDILAHLPPGARDFLSRRFLANDTLDEIAAALQMTQSETRATQWDALIQAARILQSETCCATCCATC